MDNLKRLIREVPDFPKPGINFYDITTLPLAMGLPFELKSSVGQVPDRPIRTLADLDRLAPDPQPDTYSHIRQLLKRVKEELRGELPVIVFAGAAFTVATYCIGTGKDVEATRQFAAEQPVVWSKLLDRLSHAVDVEQTIDVAFERAIEHAATLPQLAAA